MKFRFGAVAVKVVAVAIVTIPAVPANIASSGVVLVLHVVSAPTASGDLQLMVVALSQVPVPPVAAVVLPSASQKNCARAGVAVVVTPDVQVVPFRVNTLKL